MKKSNKNSSRKLMQELESAIKDLKQIQKQRDELIDDFHARKTQFTPGR